MPIALLQWWRVDWAGGDTTPPIPTITSGPTVTRLSRQVGWDSVDFTWSSNEAYVAYQARLVPSSSSPVTAGTLIESGGAGPASTPVTLTLTDDELVAAGASEGSLGVKIFVQDAAGNWSL